MACWVHALSDGYPDPLVADEVAYLLAADTFLEGRLAAPSHPHWQHFEQHGVLSQPTFASKYPPGQGAMLAFGWWLFGHPAAGVWLSAGVLVFAVGWMLLAWLPPRWTILGAALVALRFGAGHPWSESYWGGYVAAIGGAIVFGALRRVLDFLRSGEEGVGLGAWSAGLGLGLSILALTRPYEGLLVSLPAAWVLGAALFQRFRKRFRQGEGAESRRPILVVAGGVFLVLLPAFFGLGWYHHAVTGDPLRFPHRLYEETSLLTPEFVFDDAPTTATFHHADLEAIVRDYRSKFWEPDRLWVGPREALDRFGTLLYQALGPFLLVLVAGRLGWQVVVRAGQPPGRGDVCLVISSILCVALGHTATLVYMFHYSAPVLPLLLWLAVTSLRLAHDRVVTSSRFSDRLAVCLVAGMLVAEGILAGVRLGEPPREMAWYESKMEVVRELEERPGRDLVFVRYGPYHLPQWDWISNTGDLASQEIVWARTMSPEENRSLRQHFSERRAWVVDVGHEVWDPWTPPPVRLSPYEALPSDSEMDSFSAPLMDESSPP